jgi:chromosome segregation ATPase
MIRQEELAEKEKALTVANEELEQKTEKLAEIDAERAAADKHLAQKENRVVKLTEKEKDIQGRIKSIEENGQMLTLKQIEKIQTRVHAPLVGTPGIILSAEDEKNLRTTAMAAAKATEDVKKYKGVAKAAHEIIRDIVQAIGLLKFDFKGDYKPSNNLTPEQDILIAAILNHGMEISKSHGYKCAGRRNEKNQNE